MKGLSQIPTVQERTHVLEELQFHSAAVTLEQISLWTQWTRFDARLAEVVVKYFLKRWTSIHPIELNKEILLQPWPSVLGVLLEAASYGLARENGKRFQLWSQLCLVDVSPVSPQLYYIGLFQPKSRMEDKEVFECSTVFRKWGYFSSDSLLPLKKISDAVTAKDKAIRYQVLEKLIAKGVPFKTEDYMRALGFQISRRQAQRDLEQHPKLRKKGFTRSRVFIESQQSQISKELAEMAGTQRGLKPIRRP